MLAMYPFSSLFIACNVISRSLDGIVLDILHIVKASLLAISPSKPKWQDPTRASTPVSYNDEDDGDDNIFQQ